MMCLYEAHSLRVTVTVHQYPLMLLYTTGITSIACKTKSTWEYEEELCVHCTRLRSESAAVHTIMRLLTFRSAKWINTTPICRENNALSHPDGLSLIEQYVISISYIGN